MINKPIDFSWMKDYDNIILPDNGTLYMGGDYSTQYGGNDIMSLLCVITRNDFIMVASDSKYTLPTRKDGREIYGDKFFKISNTNLILGSTGNIKYGVRHFSDLFTEIDGLKDKSYNYILSYIEEYFPTYIKSNENDANNHFSNVYLVGWEDETFHGIVLSFYENGFIHTKHNMVLQSEYFSGADEGFYTLIDKIELSKKQGLLSTENDCLSFIEESFGEIIKIYESKPPEERVIGGDVIVDILYKKNS